MRGGTLLPGLEADHALEAVAREMPRAFLQLPEELAPAGQAQLRPQTVDPRGGIGKIQHDLALGLRDSDLLRKQLGYRFERALTYIRE
jgi:hypothetical protein